MLPILIYKMEIKAKNDCTEWDVNRGGSVCERGQASIGVLKQTVYFKKYENAKILENKFSNKKKSLNTD